jgi:hypothetical protein
MVWNSWVDAWSVRVQAPSLNQFKTHAGGAMPASQKQIQVKAGGVPFVDAAHRAELRRRSS